MTDFAAIDFETANYERTSICSVGVVIVRNGEIAETIYRLIRPNPDRYVFSYIHGITKADTKDSPLFPDGRCGGVCGDCDEDFVKNFPLARFEKKNTCLL
jgi:hypothetical protein